MVFVRIANDELGGKVRLVMAHQAWIGNKRRGFKVKEKLNAQERIFEILLHLQKNHVSGLSNKDLASLVGSSEANMCRDLAVFERYGMVIRSDSLKWRLSPAFGGIAGQIMKSYQTAKLQLTEEEARYMTAMQ